MAVHYAVTGDQMLEIYGKWHDIERQLRLGLDGKDKSPLDPDAVNHCLQLLGEGVVLAPEKLVLDCTHPLDPIQFLGDGWKMDEQDEQALTLTEVDFSQCLFETCLKEDETCITGEEKLKRLKEAGHVRLGGNHFLALWQDYQTHKESNVLEKLAARGTTYLDFFGLILRSPGGDRYVLCLDRDGDEWYWFYYWLGDDWDGRYFSVVSPAS